ncbi:MAG: hypothetical protein J6Q39_08820 [Bacteroidales bacterium]|nr:hypothetical protein [Bacteroidales bacterium]
MKKHFIWNSFFIFALLFCISCEPNPDVDYWHKTHFYYTNNSKDDIQIVTWNTNQDNNSVTERVYDIRQGEKLFQRCTNKGFKINDQYVTEYDFVCIPYTDSLIVKFGSDKITKTIIGNCEKENRSYLYDLNNYTYSYEEPNMIYNYIFTEKDFQNILSRKK